MKPAPETLPEAVDCFEEATRLAYSAALAATEVYGPDPETGKPGDEAFPAALAALRASEAALDAGRLLLRYLDRRGQHPADRRRPPTSEGAA